MYWYFLKDLNQTPRIKVTMYEMKNSLDGINGSLDLTEEEKKDPQWTVGQFQAT